MKKVNRYAIRYYPNESAYSNYVGFKAKLLKFKDAVKVVKRLKKSGVDAFYSKIEISV